MGQKAKPVVSKLSRTVKHQGRDLEICISAAAEGGWNLGIFDENDSGSHWCEPFASEQAALDEALKTINESDYDDFTMPLPPYDVEPRWLQELNRKR